MKKELGNFLKYLKEVWYPEENVCEIVKSDWFKKNGILYDNVLTITSEPTDLFMNYMKINAYDTLDVSYDFSKYKVNTTIYLYASEINEKEISGLTANYYIIVNDKYITGSIVSFDLDDFYVHINEVPNKYLQQVKGDIFNDLDEYTHLKEL